MHKMTRAGVQRTADYHSELAEYYKSLSDIEEAAAKAEGGEGEQQQTKTNNRSRRSTIRAEGEEEQEQQTEEEQPERELTENQKLHALHTNVAQQLRDVLNSEPATHAVTRARENVPQRLRGSLIHPTSPRLQ